VPRSHIDTVVANLKVLDRGRGDFHFVLDEINRMATIVFIHGLNTYGDDELHVGPLKFGAMHARLERALVKTGLSFVALTGLGTGSPEEQAAMAAAQVEKLGDKIPERFYLLGQSTGGLVARALGARPSYRHRVLGILTLGTPNSGTTAAEFGLKFAERSRGINRLFSFFGYDTREKLLAFKHYTPQAVAALNTRLATFATAELASTAPLTSGDQTQPKELALLCEMARAELSWPLKIFYRQLHPRGEPSDGFIWSSSQARALGAGPFALDHFGELGFFPHLLPAARRKAETEFARLVQAIFNSVSESVLK
jgi:pimeloyl-ACP methyl ester carboxylesterase